MVWSSPWHPRSFPGWHIECSAMSIEHLGEQLDIHTGGIDHIAVHHANEIAQSETFTDKPFAKFWVHHNFLRVDGEKMSKSLGNFYTIDDVLKKGFVPQALRLLFLQSHYRSEQNFTWSSLQASQSAWHKLLQLYLEIKNHRLTSPEENNEQAQKFSHDFFQALENDLGTAEALAVMWQMLKSNLDNAWKYRLLLEFDRVLGLGLASVTEANLPVEQKSKLQLEDLSVELQELFAEREKARQNKDFAKADAIRQQFVEAGYKLIDQADTVLIESI